jgi:hypothetical protein
MEMAGKARFFRWILFTLLPLLLSVSDPEAHDDLARRMLAAGDPARAQWFASLRTPSGESCCDLSDCRVTRAEWRGDTQGWWVLVDGAWRPVPADKVLDWPRSIDGAAYLCSGSHSWGNTDQAQIRGLQIVPSLPGAIYCFVPPESGS